MQRRLIFVLCVLILFSSIAFGAPSVSFSARFNPALNLLVSKKVDGTSLFARQFSIFSHPATGETTVGVLIKFKNANASEGISKLKEVGGRVHTVLPSGIATAWLPLRSLDAVRDLEAVEYAELASKNRLLLDVSRPEIGADKVRSGQGLPAAYKGEGVIVGVIDSGIDYDHQDFKHTDGSTRVAYIWDQCAEEGTPPTGYGYGNESDSVAINGGKCSEQDRHGHGTHVSGIAAGNGRSPNNNADYTGIAPEADIIVVNSLGDCENAGMEDWIIDATSYIFDKTRGMGKAAVINMSFGTHSGPHDGTSLFEQFLSELTGPGKIIVAAAGNEGSDLIHLGYQVDSKGSFSLFQPFEEEQFAVFDGWYSSSYEMKVMIGRVDANTGKVVENTNWIQPGMLIDTTFSTGQEVYIDAGETSNSQNGDRHVFMVIMGGEGFDQYLWAVGSAANQEGQTATFDVWSAADTGYFTSKVQGFVPGDNLKTVGMPATAKNIIAVAAYNTKNEWIDMNGRSHKLSDIVIGDRAGFSSIGPSRDGRLKPDIAAPGCVIVSALTSDIPIGSGGIPQRMVVSGGYYQVMCGTSMSSPHIAGTVALMLQQNPALDYKQVMEILAKSARSDQYTGQLPNQMWGYGKVDAYEAVATVRSSESKVDIIIPPQLKSKSGDSAWGAFRVP